MLVHVVPSQKQDVQVDAGTPTSPTSGGQIERRLGRGASPISSSDMGNDEDLPDSIEPSGRNLAWMTTSYERLRSLPGTTALKSEVIYSAAQKPFPVPSA